MAHGTVDLSRKTILTLDDDPNMRGVIRASLERHGCRSILATGNGHRALELLAQHHVDIVICDMQMDEMDGLTFLAQARSRKGIGDFRVIMLTAGSPEAGKDALQELRINAWLFKPVSALRLIEAMGAVLGGRIEAVMPEADTDRVLSAIADRYRAKLASDLASLQDQVQRLPGAEGGADFRQHWRALRNLLHDMKGQAGTFGLDLVTTLAGMGDDMMRRAGDAAEYGVIPFPEVNRGMQVIASAIALVVQNDIRGDGGPTGEKLREKIETFLVPLRQKLHVELAPRPVEYRRGWN